MNAITLRTMGIHRNPINLFFLIVAGVLLAAGVPAGAAESSTAPTGASAATAKKPKKASDRLAVVRFHIEVTDDGNGPRAEVIRSQPQSFAVSKAPFFEERDLASAQVAETPDGGFVVQIDCTDHGKNALEMTTAASNGRHILIYGQWSGDDGIAISRWLAAPLIRGANRSGSIRFSVDADRNEAQQFVDGLNNVAIKLKNQVASKGGSPTPSSKKLPVNTGSAASDAINKGTRQ